MHTIRDTPKNPSGKKLVLMVGLPNSDGKGMNFCLHEMAHNDDDFFISGLCALSVDNDNGYIAYPGSSQVRQYNE